MISCKRAAELITLSQEMRLTWRQRLALFWHLACCSMCRTFRRQMGTVQKAGRAAGQDEETPERPQAALSEAAKERIRRRLREHDSGSP